MVSLTRAISLGAKSFRSPMLTVKFLCTVSPMESLATAVMVCEVSVSKSSRLPSATTS